MPVQCPLFFDKNANFKKDILQTWLDILTLVRLLPQSMANTRVTSLYGMRLSKREEGKGEMQGNGGD